MDCVLSLSLLASFHSWYHHHFCHLAGSKSGHGYSRQWRTRARTDLLQLTTHYLFSQPQRFCFHWLLVLDALKKMRTRSPGGVIESEELAIENDLSLFPNEAAERDWDILSFEVTWEHQHSPCHAGSREIHPILFYPLLSYLPGPEKMHSPGIYWCAIPIRFLLEIQMLISLQLFFFHSILTYIFWTYIWWTFWILFNIAFVPNGKILTKGPPNKYKNAPNVDYFSNLLKFKGQWL